MQCVLQTHVFSQLDEVNQKTAELRNNILPSTIQSWAHRRFEAASPVMALAYDAGKCLERRVHSNISKKACDSHCIDMTPL